MEPAVLTSKNWTEADLQRLPEDGYTHEVVDGELVMSPKNDFFHGSISSQLSMALREFVKLAIAN
jgi:hypothetical protein